MVRVHRVGGGTALHQLQFHRQRVLARRQARAWLLTRKMSHTAIVGWPLLSTAVGRFAANAGGLNASRVQGTWLPTLHRMRQVPSGSGLGAVQDDGLDVTLQPLQTRSG